MWDGNVKVALYVNEKANEAQKEAITKIISGQAGGLFGELSKAITQFLGTKSVRMDFKKQDGKFSLTVPSIIAASIEPLKGHDDKVVEIHNSPLVWSVNIDKSITNKFTDHTVSWSYSGTNGSYADFELADP